MAKGFLNFYKISGPSATKVAEDKADKIYKKLRIQAFLAATFGYSLYYVCRTTLNVVKQPIIDSGLLDAAQLGVVSSCLLFAYAIGKFVNGFLADYCNIKRFMATGLVVSAFMNFLMGIFGFTEGALGITNIVLFLSFSIMWCINGWAQSMGAPPAIISLSRWFPLKSRGAFSGWFSDTLFKGDRKYSAFIFGVLNTVALCLFLFGGNGWLVNALSMVLFGIAVGVLICFLGGLMAVDLVPRKATGAALGIVGMASYIAAGLQDIISGQLIERFVREVPRVVNGVATMVKEYDFHYAAYFWIAASVISFLLPILNWHRKQQKI